MPEDKPKSTHGGKRREGRTQTMKSYRVDNDLVEFLKQRGNANAYVNEAIREKMNRDLKSKKQS